MKPWQWLNFFRSVPAYAEVSLFRKSGMILSFLGLVLCLWNARGWNPTTAFMGGIALTSILCFGLAKSIGQMKSLILVLLGFHSSLLTIRESKGIIFAVVFLLVFDFGCLLRMHLKTFSREVLFQSLRAALKSTLFALPFLALLAFILRNAYHQRLASPSPSAITGIRNFLRPGQIEELKVQSGIAYQIRTFPELPPFVVRYWPVSIFTKSKGLIWDHSIPLFPGQSVSTGPNRLAPDNCVIQQEIYPWEENDPPLVVLDVPLQQFGRKSDSRYNTEYLDEKSREKGRENFFTNSAPNGSNGYPSRVSSTLCQERVELLTVQARNDLLKVQEPITKELQALVSLWKGKARSPLGIAHEAIQYFKSQRFTYSLHPKRGDKETTLAEFIFEYREGFCEHYAGALATLMRVAGIPARVVVGFAGGKYNKFGDFWMLSLGDVHAWTELWDAGRWVRVDPTLIFLPEKRSDRISILEKAAETIGLVWDAFRFRIQELSVNGGLLWPMLIFCLFFVCIKFYRKLEIGNRIFGFYSKSLEQQFQQEFENFCKVIGRSIGARHSTEGYDSYRVRILGKISDNPRYAEFSKSIHGLFMFYEIFRYGSQSWSQEALKVWITRAVQLRLSCKRIILQKTL